MLASVKQLAIGAWSVLWPGHHIPIREGQVAARRDHGAVSCPKYQVLSGMSEVTIRFEVPGATPEATELRWDSALRTLTLEVALPERRGHLTAVLGFTTDVDGAKGKGALKDGMLVVRLPRRDIDTLTGLPELLQLTNPCRSAPHFA
ncbi:MAG TPA: Hsp20/alpha crystallin family protein [Polyangiaceae bacterium]|nr:Hsp20/alpha crystallin family protein [Polyangiaceae bacterium]